MWNSKEKHMPSDWERHYEKDCTQKGLWGKKRNLRVRDGGREDTPATGKT